MAWSVPANVSAATTILASTTNTILGDLTWIGQAWPAYTPTTTGITLGNGTVTGRANMVGTKTVDFQAVFTFGSTSALTGTPSFTLPATAQSLNWVTTNCSAFDTSASAWYPVVGIPTTTTVLTCRTWPTTAGNNFAVMSSTVPFTWATGDILSVTGRFEVA